MSAPARDAKAWPAVWAALLALVLAAPARAGSGLDWLLAQQNPDGSYGGTPASLATPVQATAEALRAQQALRQDGAASFDRGLSFLRSLAEVHAEFTARRLAIEAIAGSPVDPVVAALLSLQNGDGGFGDNTAQQSTILSTAFALEALAVSAQAGTPLRGAVGYLLNHQMPDGSFADGANAGSILLTAQSMRALIAYRATYAGVAGAITAAQNFLLSQRAADALWAEDFLSAAALLALAPAVADVSLIDDSAAALLAHQRADSSWQGDAYTTALAIQALFAYDNRKAGTPPPLSGSIAGHVVRANSTEPVGQATVTITESPGASVLTSGDGYYLLPALPTGHYTVTATKAGYGSASTVVSVDARQATVAPDLILDLQPQTGLVRGLVFDADSKAPLQGVQVTLGGPSSRSVLSNAAGLFDFGPVTPGSYSISFALAGYSTLSGAATVVAGQTLSTQLGLALAGGYQDASPGVVRGLFVDGKTNQPLAGATFDLGGGRSGVSGADGSFGIAAVPRGSYQGTARATGYQSITFNLLFSAGASGDVGTVALFPTSTVPPPTTLNLTVRVLDGVSGAAIAGATATVVETGATAASGADGRARFAGLALKSFNVSLAAAGYQAATYGVQVGAFGDAEVTLRLSPPGSGDTTSTLSGSISNALNRAPIAGAVVSVVGGSLSATTGADGHYSLPGIEPVDFRVNVAAVGFQQQTFTLHLTSRGAFALDAPLQPVAGTAFQIVGVASTQPSWSANSTATFTARVASLLTAAKSALVIGEIQDATGAPIASVTPYAEGTTTPSAQFSFAPNEVKDLVVPWSTGQLAPGSYKLVLRVVEPGSINRAVPLGTILAESGGYATVAPTQALAGGVIADPPLTQAGLPTAIKFSAVVQNGGNVALPAGTYSLTLPNPADGSALFTADADAPELAVGQTATIAFGSWVPTAAGSFTPAVRRKAGDVGGAITGTLYVGDKASGTFTVDRTLVPEGTQTVRGHVGMQGVDTSQGSTTDPLINLVRASVTKGGGYVAPAAINWYQTNRCLGCHIESQSLLGLSASFGKGDIDRAATKQLYNGIVSSQWLDGALRISHPEYAKTQTTLDLWSLGAWQDKQGTFRVKYRAAQYLQNVKYRQGDQTVWYPDHASGWWNTPESHTSMTVKAYAGLLRDAANVTLSSVADYSLGSASTIPSGSVEGMTAGPDGALYFATNAGVIYRLDPATAAITAARTGLPGDIQGLAYSPNGTLFVSTASGTLIRFNPDNSRVDTAIGGFLADVAVGPDGLVYLADYYGQRILRVNAVNQVETFAGGGLFSYPHSLAFDAAGSLLIANQYGYNILKVATDRTVSIYAEGLAYQAIRMALLPDGSLYLTSAYPGYNNGGIMKVRTDGTVERVLQQDGILGVGAIGSSLYFANNYARTVQPLVTAPLDTGDLASLKAEIAYGARFLLAGYADNNGDHTVHAQRIIGLAESRDMVDDVLAAQIDTAVAYEANFLRGRQNPDGGWGRYTNYPSDPLVTAMVGIALEYTSPSATDVQIRAAIQYLLNTQLPDGSWDNFYNGLSTRLASTSFVMIFMPKALERLGGIDVTLKLALAANVQLGNPTLAPTAVQVNADQTTDYTWQLLGVTSTGRQVDFDLKLLTMGLHETRPAALQALLEFNNSFVDGKIDLPLAIPSVRSESQLALGVSVDKPSYQANENATIQSVVGNGGAVAASGQVLLSIRAPGSAAHLVELPPLAVQGLAAGGQITLPTIWNTGATLAGDYEAYGRLLDSSGRVVSEGAAPFRIGAPAAVAASAVSTDKRIYTAWEAVTISGRAQNTAPNAILPPSFVEVSVVAPSAQTIFSAAADVEQLSPGGLKTMEFRLKLSDAAAGTYPVTLVLKDKFTRAVLSTSSASFQVQRQAVQSLLGTVAVASREVHQGDPNGCTEIASNAGAAAATGVTLIHRLLNADASTVIEDKTELVTIAGNSAAAAYLHSIDTQSLAPGGYACVLLAQTGAGTRPLASAAFKVLPPVARTKIAAAMGLGGRGRLLVFLDGPRAGCDDHDHLTANSGGCGCDHSLPSAPQAALAAQRTFLEGLLKADGWSYTIVLSEADFSAQLRTGGYVAYAAFSSAGRLSTQTQQELREAVFRGEGLLVSGARNGHLSSLRDALGVTLIGHVQRAASFAPTTPASPLVGTVSIFAGEVPLRIARKSAASLAVFQEPTYTSRSGDDGCGDDSDDGDGGADDHRSLQAFGGTRGDGGHGDDGHGDDGGGGVCQGHPERYRDAITLNPYGLGQGAFAGVDLLTIAARDGQASAAADDLRTVLHLVQPASVATLPGAVVPVQVTVTNQASAATVAVVSTLPAGTKLIDPTTGVASGQTVTFSFPLAEAAVKTVRFWVRLPVAAGPVTLSATSTATASGQAFAVTTSLALTVPAVKTADQLRAASDALAHSDAANRAALNRATAALRSAAGHSGSVAFADGLRAAESLLGIGASAVVQLRVAIDQWLRSAALTSNP